MGGAGEGFEHPAGGGGACASVADKCGGDAGAGEVRRGKVRNDEAVAVLMEDEASFDFVAGNGFVLGEFIWGWRLGRGTLLGGRLLRAGSLGKKEAAVGKFFDEAAFLELG